MSDRSVWTRWVGELEDGYSMSNRSVWTRWVGGLEDGYGGEGRRNRDQVLSKSFSLFKIFHEQ